MDEISVRVLQGTKNLKDLQTPVSEGTIDGLLAALKEAKETTNSFLTELVNQQKTPVGVRKIEELASSDEDGDDPSKKQKR